MRPVIVPAPSRYITYVHESKDVTGVTGSFQRDGSQIRMTAQEVVGFTAGTPVKRSDILNTLNNLVGTWVTDKCPWEKGSLAFKKNKDDDKYRAGNDIIAKGPDDWGDARRDLIENLGQYCSYCGSPIYSMLHIEHRLPKSTFPLRAFDYTNFLLSCATCNSAKGSKPNQGTIDGNPVGTNAATSYIENATEPHYLWPNYNWDSVVGAAGALPSFPLTCALHWVCRGPKCGNLTTDSEFNGVLTRFRQGELEIYEGMYRIPKDGRFGVIISARDGLLKRAAENVIDLADLNGFVPVAKTRESVDRTMETRTRAYLTASIVKAQLTDAAVAADPDLLVAVIEQAKQTIRASGHWLVWLTVLGSDIYNGTTAQALIRGCMAGTSPKDWLV